MKLKTFFLSISEGVVWLAGHRFVLATMVTLVVAWCAFGLALGLPTEWFLMSNIVGTMTALFILLVMQYSQNRDMHALQVKVDELIRSSGAGNHMIGVERLEAHELAELAADRHAGV